MNEIPKRRFQDLLDDLQDRLLAMAGEAEEAIRRAVRALETRDADLARAVWEGDESIDRLELDVDERALEVLALQQPMAGDLRRIVATLKISNDLERVGDHASKIGRAVETLSEHTPVPLPPQLGEMAAASISMLSDSLSAYTDRNAGLAREVRARDGRVNEYRNSLHRILVTYMFEDARRITPALELILVSQSLERVADLATNIAEEVVFLVEGTVIRHSPGNSGQS